MLPEVNPKPKKSDHFEKDEWFLGSENTTVDGFFVICFEVSDACCWELEPGRLAPEVSCDFLAGLVKPPLVSSLALRKLCVSTFRDGSYREL